jgi:hypothetical protein
MIVRCRWLLLLPLLLAGPSARAKDLDWQNAIAQLGSQRTVAETCVGLLKKYGDPGARDRGSQVYADAKGDFDGIIAGLIVALARNKQPDSLSDLQARLTLGFQKREAFCQSVAPLIPPAASGQKGIVEEIVKGALEPVIQAVVEIYKNAQQQDELTRGTIQTQLEATQWPAFASVSPSP